MHVCISLNSNLEVYSTNKTISWVSKLTPASILIFAITGSCKPSCIFSKDSAPKTG